MTSFTASIPHTRVPVHDRGGLMTPEWYRFYVGFQKNLFDSAVSPGSGISSSNGTISIAQGGVTRAMLAQSLPLSVICNPVNDTEAPQDLQAGDNGRVLMRDGDVLAFRITKVPSFTVATLPSAAAQGAGTIVFASDARNASEGAGSGTGSLVCSDGTSWKIPGIAGAVAA